MKTTLNPKCICQSAQEDSQAVIDCKEAQKKTKNKLQKKYQETQKGVGRNTFTQAKGTHRQCKAEPKSSEV